MDAIFESDLSDESVEALAILLTALVKAVSESVRNDIFWDAISYLFRETKIYYKSFDQFSKSVESRSKHLTSVKRGLTA